MSCSPFAHTRYIHPELEPVAFVYGVGLNNVLGIRDIFTALSEGQDSPPDRWRMSGALEDFFSRTWTTRV